MKLRNKYNKGGMVYPIWRLDKNISWHNFFTYHLGLLYGLITFEWIRPKCKYMKWRLTPWKMWLPPKFA